MTCCVTVAYAAYQILQDAKDTPDIITRSFMDRGWASKQQMSADCLAAWQAKRHGTVARGQSKKEADHLVAELKAAGFEVNSESDQQELCSKKRKRNVASELPSCGERVTIRDEDSSNTRCATVLAVDATRLLIVVVSDDGEFTSALCYRLNVCCQVLSASVLG